jgi:hypothetical protein
MGADSSKAISQEYKEASIHIGLWNRSQYISAIFNQKCHEATLSLGCPEKRSFSIGRPDKR